MFGGMGAGGTRLGGIWLGKLAALTATASVSLEIPESGLGGSLLGGIGLGGSVLDSVAAAAGLGGSLLGGTGLGGSVLGKLPTLAIAACVPFGVPATGLGGTGLGGSWLGGTGAGRDCVKMEVALGAAASVIGLMPPFRLAALMSAHSPAAVRAVQLLNRVRSSSNTRLGRKLGRAVRRRERGEASGRGCPSQRRHSLLSHIGRLLS